MRAAVIMTAVVAGLAGCAGLTQETDMIARNSAKLVVNDVIAQQLPGVDARPVTDCVIDNASGQEIVQIAQASMMGATPATTDLVLNIAQRPQTAACLADQAFGMGNLLGTFG